MIIRSGCNVYPSEIEKVILEHGMVLDCASVGQDDAHRGESMIAYVVTKLGAALTADDMLAFCRHRLARYKVPAKIYLFDSLPRNPLGKVQKDLLKEMKPS